MIDIVLDTCTLVHANNSDSDYQEHSIILINKLLENSTLVTVDEGFSLDESNHSSYIALEYLKHLSPGMLGHSLLSFLASNERFNFISNKVPKSTKNYIEQKIRNKKDRMFLRIAYNSQEKTLASHDYTDYQKNKRKTIKKDINVLIVDAEDINESL